MEFCRTLQEGNVVAKQLISSLIEKKEDFRILIDISSLCSSGDMSG